MALRHFLSLLDFSSDELHMLIAQAIELKSKFKAGVFSDSLRSKTLGMIFDASSTRTRISFEVAMTQLGGHAIFLTSDTTQLERGEPVADTAEVMSRLVDIVVIRTTDHNMVETFSSHSKVPVINGLTHLYHPCQLLADIQTFQEHRGDIQGRKVAWVGDGCNMCHSWMNAALRFDFELHVATPRGFEPSPDVYARAASNVSCTEDPRVAVRDADVVVTDTWVSLGQDTERDERAIAFAGFCVDEALMESAKPDAIFMHCLPAYRGYEVSAEVLASPQSVIWDQAENRLHAQKALLVFLLS